jgi:pimeloyl-ACP methyl ester carboxylesterase
MTVMKRHELSGVPGVRWVPDHATGVGALVLAGSSGRVQSSRAELLARHGVLAESIQWFGGPGQHDGPWEIPLELFLDRVADLVKGCDRIIVLGTSFGTEAALLTGAHSAHVAAVVALAPSDVVWAGVTPNGRVTSH